MTVYCVFNGAKLEKVYLYESDANALVDEHFTLALEKSVINKEDGVDCKWYCKEMELIEENPCK
jgi:hypothetical protein